MTIFSLILLATAVSIDGFWGGFAFGLRKIKIPLLSLTILSGWSVVCTMITMNAGRLLMNYISFDTAKWIGATLLFIIGFMALKEGIKHRNSLPRNEQASLGKDIHFKDLFKILDNPLLADIDQENDIKPHEATLLGLAVAMDASVAAFTVALAGFNPWTTPFLFGLTHFVLIGLGNVVAMKKIVNCFAEKFALLPGSILMLLGVMRLL